MALEKRQRYEIEDRAKAAAPGKISPRSETAVATLGSRPLLSNRGVPLNLDWIEQIRVNTSAVERRAQTHVARRTVKK